MAAGVVTLGFSRRLAFLAGEDKFLENLAKHFGVNGDFVIGWGVLLNGEIVAFEEVVEHGSEHVVADLKLVVSPGDFVVLFIAVFVRE